ncbi:hypothetical protein IWZ03DRAFT_99752 [Phyllosticta citriasiana]|uniref:DUF7918 domain-containing protein n=1 Tax=Phyllosticta citriasiana TaxID=595635 RepID=A0ABR1KUA2_9PEZI
MEPPKEVQAFYAPYDGANDDSEQDSEEENFGAGLDGPSDRRNSYRDPRVPLSYVAGSLTGTSSASRIIPTGELGNDGGYYAMFRPHAQLSASGPRMPEPAPRRRFRPSSDCQPGVMWMPPEMNKNFTVVVETARESDSLASEANRRPSQVHERARTKSKDKGNAQNSTENPVAEEQPATFKSVVNAGFDNEAVANNNAETTWKNDDASQKADPAWKPDNGSDKAQSRKSDSGSQRFEQAWQPDQGSNKPKSHDSSKAPSSISYMHVPSVPEEPIIKSYWKNWNKRPVEQKKKLAECLDTSSGFLTAPSEVPDQVPEREAKKRGLKHQVHAGQGMEYRHRLGVPLYKDTMENPYAVFRFKYRTRETLKKMDSRREFDWEKVKKREEQKKLMNLSKEELVEQLMKKSSISRKSSSVKQSVKAPSDTGHKSVKSWLQTVPEATSSKKSEKKSKSSSGEPTTCDICKKILDYGADKWWHCDACSFDMCLSCTKDNWCKDKDHRLEKWGGSCAAGNGQFLNKTTGEQGVTGPVNSPNKKSGSQNGKPDSHHSSSHSRKSRAGSAQKEPEEPAGQWEPIVGFDSANEKAGRW